MSDVIPQEANLINWVYGLQFKTVLQKNNSQQLLYMSVNTSLIGVLYWAYQFKVLQYGSYGQHSYSCSVFLYINYNLLCIPIDQLQFALYSYTSTTICLTLTGEGLLNSRYSTNFKKSYRKIMRGGNRLLVTLYNFTKIHSTMAYESFHSACF